MMIKIKHITQKMAFKYISEHHRHHKPPQGAIICIGAYQDNEILGVLVIGRPVSRHLDNGDTLEITRICTTGTKNLVSMLCSRAIQLARLLGYKQLITYTLEVESGASMKASSFQRVYSFKGRSWNWKGRPRVDKHPTVGKTLWRKYL